MPNIPIVKAVRAFTPMKNPNSWDMKLNATIHIPPNAELTINLNNALMGFEKTTISIQPKIIPII